MLLALLQSLSRVSGIDTDRAEAALLDLLGRDLPRTDRSELTRTMMQMLVGLHVVRNKSASKDQLRKFEEDPIQFHREVTEEIYAAAAYLRPPNAMEPETAPSTSKVFRGRSCGFARFLEPPRGPSSAASRWIS